MKFGIEKEFFVKIDIDTFALPKDIGLEEGQCDECGYLAEARSKPFSDPNHTIFDLELEIEKLNKKKTKGMLIDIPRIKLPYKLMWKATRTFGKGRSEDECLYGEVKPKNRIQTAGIHIHFSDKDRILNIPRIVKFLDNKFKDEIKNTKRQFGLYEMKPWGFEYRSLPCNTDLNKIKQALIEIQEQ